MICGKTVDVLTHIKKDLYDRNKFHLSLANHNNYCSEI